MNYTNSSMVVYTKLSPNNSGQRTHAIDRITPHCVVGQCTVEGLGGWFESGPTHASSNYGIDKDGRVGMYVEEKNRSWCTSSNSNDQRAITIECASEKTEPYEMRDVVYQTLITLCIDICKRNGKSKLLWFGDKDKALNYNPRSDEMIITVHRWFANKSCPGEWLYSRLGELAEKVTASLGGVSDVPAQESEKPTTYPEKLTDGWYSVRKTWADSKSQLGAYRYMKYAKAKADENPGYKVFDPDGNAFYPETTKPATTPEPTQTVPFLVNVKITDLNIRTGPGTDHSRTGKYTGFGVFTIVEVKSGKGSTAGWGRLKSGAGWVSLDYATKL